jgi:hypothetical protein
MARASEEKSKKAYDLGYKYEGVWGDCSQATMRALMEVYDEVDKNAFKGMAGFHGGGGCECDGSCGAYCASIGFLSMHYGRELDSLGKDPADPKSLVVLNRLNGLIKKVHDKFIADYGSIICSQIHRKLYGRSFYFNDPDDIPKFEKLGGHDWGCTGVVGSAAKWTVEVIGAEEK